MANAVVNRQVNVYINSGEAAKAYDVLIKREKLLNAELAKTADPKRIKALTAELDKLKDPIERAAKKMKGELAPSIRELELATRKFLNEFKKTGSPEALANFQKFRAELAKAKTDLNGLETSSKGLTSKGIFSGAFWGSFLAGGVTAALSGLSNLFRGSIQEALDADAATRRLEGTLDNLGRSDVFDRISRKADEMAAKFRYLDNDDIVAVFNKLIDYGKLTEKEMNDLLPVIIDFAAKSQVSIDESASVIIKALEGNGKALKEYGIDIKDAGNETDRLNVIMTTLKEKVDGSGEAFQNSAKGGIATARQELKNLQEDIGSLIIPALNKLLSFVVGAVKGLKQFAKDVRNVFSSAGRAQSANEMNENIAGDVASTKFQEIIKKIEAFDAQKRIKTLMAEYNFEVDMVNDALKKINKGGISFAEIDEINKSINSRKKLMALLDDQMKIEKDTKALGIDTGDDPVKSDKGNAKVLKRIDLLKESWAALFAVQEKGEQLRQRYAGQQESVIDKADKLLKANLAAVNAITGIDPVEDNKRIDRNRLAKNELAVLTSRAKARLQAHLSLLKEEERQELDNKKLTENEKLLIEEQYRIKRKEAEDGYLAGLIENFANYASQALSIFTMFGDMKTQEENAELERDRRLHDRKANNLDRRLKKGLITELQYRREMDKLDREQEAKEKKVRIAQFQRNKREKLVQATINTAEGVAEAIPNPFLVALAAATGAAQISIIAAQKAPEFAAGGRLGGRSHASGGNAVIDGSGRKIAEVEAGEGIVNKRTMADRRQFNVSGTPGQIISSLNGMYGNAWEGGATLVPGWRSHSPQRMNYNAMKGVYAAGGQFSTENSGGIASQGAIFENFSALLSDMQATNQYLANILANGITADVSLIRFEEQQDRLAAIRRDATMVP